MSMWYGWTHARTHPGHASVSHYIERFDYEDDVWCKGQINDISCDWNADQAILYRRKLNQL